MTDRIQNLWNILKDGGYKKRRTSLPITLTAEEEQLHDIQKDVIMLQKMYEAETPFFHQGETMGFNRSNTLYYCCDLPNGKFGPLWGPGNVVMDFETVLNCGMDAVADQIRKKLREDCDEDQVLFLTAALECLELSLAYADREAAAAREQGFHTLADALSRVPRKKAESLHDACVFLKFIHFTIRCNRNTLMTLGRFDKYMRPFYEADLARGLSRAELFDVVQEFFLSLNFDTDLYQGVRKGDNGQSLVLGGCGSFDDFSHLCMEASLELNLIDPKINLRVDKNTPDELLEFATLMTKQGMGFPQYSNDDLVIPAMIAMGYDKEDAEDYAVAACWEFIVPGKAMDVPNLFEMVFPRLVNEVIEEKLMTCQTFEELLEAAKNRVVRECDLLVDTYKNYKLRYSPYLSVYIRGCIEKGRDLADYAAKYNNFGGFGIGVATAADSLAAVREVIFETGDVTKEQLLDALQKDFEGYGELRNRLLACPKMGQGNDRTDAIGRLLMETYGKHLTGRPNSAGGIFRAGTGSAQKYWFRGRELGASADGRRAGQPFGCSFSPSLEARLDGPLSCIRSFTGFELSRNMNGGPLTMELHDNVFRNEEGIKKVAQLVKAFIHLGGHQLQLNCVNRERLQDAVEHPENHKNLIVRVWGWSGYFVELDEPFQQHILKRTEFTM